MPKLKKYLDWKGYFVALYKNWIHSLTSTLIALGGTNAIESMGVKGIGLSWQQAGGVFVGITFWEIVKYLNAKPLPDEKEESIETAIIDQRDLQASKKTEGGFNILEVLITTAVIALIIGVACLCSGCNTYKGLFPGKNIIVEDFEADQSGWGVQSKIRAKKVQSNVAETNCHNPEIKPQ